MAVTTPAPRIGKFAGVATTKPVKARKPLRASSAEPPPSGRTAAKAPAKRKTQVMPGLINRA